MPDKSLRYRFLGQDAGLGKTMGGLGDHADKLHSSLGKLAGAFAGGIAGAGAVSFLKDSIGNASDLNESLSKTRVVFGQASRGVEIFAKTAATGIGQSQQDALEATSTFGNLFRALGIGVKPAADLSVKIVKLAGDLASFNNVDPAEALDALKSGLLGEAEPLRKFGVTLSQARVEAEALADGIVKPTKDSGKVRTALLNVEVATRKLAEAQKGHSTSTLAVQVAQRKLTEAQQKYGAGSLEAKVAAEKLSKAQETQAKSQKDSGPHSLAAKVAANNLAKANEALTKATKGTVPELTAAQKAQASYNIIMKDTKTAQGDFARTSGGLANQQRILKAEFKDASAQLGTKLYPAATKVVTKLSDALKPGSKFNDVLDDLGKSAKDFANDAKPIFSWIGDHPDLFSKIAKDAVIFGGILKAKSFLTGMGLLKGLTGGSALAGAGGVLGKVGSPVPVFVTNAGGVPGVGGPGTPGVPGSGGKGIPGEPTRPGIGKKTIPVPGAGFVDSIGWTALVTGVVNGILGEHATYKSRQEAAGGVRKALGSLDAKAAGTTSDKELRSVLSQADKIARGSGVSYDPKHPGRYLVDPKVPTDISKAGTEAADFAMKVRRMLAAGGGSADRYLDDPRRGRAARIDQSDFNRGVLGGGYSAPVTKGDLAHLLTVGAKPSVQNYYITVNGLTIDQALNEAHRRARVHAVGGVNNAATRDRNM